MATAAVEEKCPCGAEFAMTIETEDVRAIQPGELGMVDLGRGEPDSYVVPTQAFVILEALRLWREQHAHRKPAPPQRRAFGLLAAVSRDTVDGEGAGEWDGMYASPAEEDDDE